MVKVEDDSKVLDLIENDKIEDESSVMAIVSQNDDMLAFSIDGLYKDDKHKKYKTGKALKENPPILRVSSGKGDEVQFLLTKEFSRHLYSALNEVNKAYAGYVYVTKDEDKPKLEKLKSYIKEKPITAVFSFISILIIIYVLAKGI